MFQKSRVLLALAILIAAPNLKAYDICSYPDCDYAVQYPYIGAILNGIQYNAQAHTYFPVDSTSPLLQDETKISQAHITGGLSLGYAMRWSGRWYFAAEVSSLPVAFSSERTWVGSNSGFNYDTNIKMMNVFNADGMPGYYLNCRTLLYLRAGVAVANVEVQQKNFFGDDYDKRNTVGGYRFGIGMDYSLSHHWVAGLDYIYTNYGMKKFDNNIIGGGGVNSLRTELRSYTNFVGLHINYKFDVPVVCA